MGVATTAKTQEGDGRRRCSAGLVLVGWRRSGFRKAQLPGLGLRHPLRCPVLEDLLVRLVQVRVADEIGAGNVLRTLRHWRKSSG